MTDETSDKMMRQSLQAGFNADWKAAYISLAMLAEKQGRAEFAMWMHKRSDKPDRVEIVNMDDPPAES